MANKHSKSSVLIALNDVPTLTVISYHLERYGFVVNSVQTTEMLLNTAEKIEPNIIILDEDFAGDIKAIEACSMLKKQAKTKKTNIIFVSKVAPLDSLPIDDSIIKPFIPSALVKKVQLFATPQHASASNQKIISYQDIEMNLSTFRITSRGRSSHLGPNEFKILQCFIELPGRILSREHIMNYVWGPNSQVEPRTIDVHINRLRVALKDHYDELPLIKTIRSEGYSLNSISEMVKS